MAAVPGVFADHVDENEPVAHLLAVDRREADLVERMGGGDLPRLFAGFEVMRENVFDRRRWGFEAARELAPADTDWNQYRSASVRCRTNSNNDSSDGRTDRWRS